MNFRSLLLLCALTGPAAAGVFPGNVDTSFTASVDDIVRTTAVQTDGKIWVGGDFSRVNGVARSRVARLHTDGTLDTFNANLTENVGIEPLYVVSQQTDGKIVLGGGFTTAAGVTRNNIARFNVDNTLDPGFNPNPNADVWCTCIQTDGSIVLGGQFGSMNGTSRGRIARVSAAGVLDGSFNPNSNNTVSTVALQADGRMVLGGPFTTMGGTSRSRIARVNANGTLDTTFNPNANDHCRAIAIQADGKIIVAGLFTMVGGTTRNHLARLNADGTLDGAFNPNVNDEILTVAVQCDGRIIIAGKFTMVGTTARNGIARILSDGSLDPSFNPNADGFVYSAAIQSDGKIILGGDFSTVGGEPRMGLAKLNNDPAIQNLTVPGSTRVQWLRGGAAQETHYVSFEFSTNGGTAWAPLGSGTRIPGGWELTGLNLPAAGHVRARARVASGRGNGSSWLIETVSAYNLLTPQQTWRQANFGTPDNSGNAADNADPDKDGLENLVEFAFGRNPNTPDAAALPQWVLTDDDYSLTFTRPAGVDGITYIGEYSTSMATGSWTPAVNVSTPPAYHFLAPAITERLYLRVRVTAP